MLNVRPISDLRNKFTEISKTVHETGDPVILTKNGYGDMVVLSMEAYNNMKFEYEVYYKLLEAEKEEEENPDGGCTIEEAVQAMKDSIYVQA